MAHKIQWLGRYPIHALGKNGEQVTILKGEIKEVSELPEADVGSMKVFKDSSHEVKTPKKRENIRGKK